MLLYAPNDVCGTDLGLITRVVHLGVTDLYFSDANNDFIQMLHSITLLFWNQSQAALTALNEFTLQSWTFVCR